MFKFIIVTVIAWFVGVLGWAQIIGSMQNLQIRRDLLFTLMFRKDGVITSCNI